MPGAGRFALWNWRGLITVGRRKVHFTFADGAEMVEEYDAQTGALLCKQAALKAAHLAVRARGSVGSVCTQK